MNWWQAGAVIAAWTVFCIWMRQISSDDNVFIESDPDVWIGPW